MRRPAALAAIAGALFLLGGCTLFGPKQPLGEAALQRLGAPPVDLARPPAYAEVAGIDRLGRTPAQDEAPSPAELEFTPAAMTAQAPAAPLRVGVEEAVLLALRNNRSLSVQQLQPVVAGTFEEIERAVFDPVLFAEGQLGLEEVQQTDRATGQLFSVRGDSSIVSGGVRQFLPTGTEVAASLQHRRTDSDRTPEQHATRAGVTLTQALLRGRGLEANLARIAQAELDTLASIYELRGFTEALVAEVESAYWSFVLARREIEIFEESLALARRQLAETERRIAVGLLPETELAAARAEVARRQQGLIEVEADREQARLRLLRLLNPPQAGWQRAIVVDDDPPVPEVALDPVEDHVALALRLRPDLNEARLRAEQGRLEVVQTGQGLLPVLDLFITLGKSGFADSFTGAVGAIDEPGYDFTAGLRAEYPIGNRAARAFDLRARTSRDQARIGLDNLAQLVSLDVRITHLEIDRARRQIAASAITRAAQEEVVRAELAKFAAGTSTAFFVAQAQRDLLEARIVETRAVVAYRLALIDLYRFEGSLLVRRGIAGPGAQPVQSPIAPLSADFGRGRPPTG